MQFQLLLLTALASLASSVPHRPWRFEPLEPATRKFISGIEGRRQTIQEEMPHVPNCNNYDISNAQMSPLPSEIPPPSVGLTPYHVTIGRGTQVSKLLFSALLNATTRRLMTNYRIIPAKPSIPTPRPCPCQPVLSQLYSTFPATPP